MPQPYLAQSIDERISTAMNPVSSAIQGVVFYSVPVAGVNLPLIVLWLVAAGAVFTVYLGVINLRGPEHALALVRGEYSNPDDAGEVTHFQALATAVSGTVGLGNIAGVAVAIAIGGPGATVWMIIAGCLGMSSKMAECALGVKYRRERPDGTVSSGPMYYLERGIAEVTGHSGGGKKVGKTLAVLFSVSCIGGAIGAGNMFQANQATAQIIAVTGGADSPIADLRWIVGLFFAVAVGAVIIGELIVGFQRAVFSNAAGIDSAAIAHAAVRTEHPSTEGHVDLLEPFIDTIIIMHHDGADHRHLRRLPRPGRR